MPNDWLNKLWYYIMEYGSSIKRNKLLAYKQYRPTSKILCQEKKIQRIISCMKRANIQTQKQESNFNYEWKWGLTVNELRRTLWVIENSKN